MLTQVTGPYTLESMNYRGRFDGVVSALSIGQPTLTLWYIAILGMPVLLPHSSSDKVSPL